MLQRQNYHTHGANYYSYLYIFLLHISIRLILWEAGNLQTSFQRDTNIRTAQCFFFQISFCLKKTKTLQLYNMDNNISRVTAWKKYQPFFCQKVLQYDEQMKRSCFCCPEFALRNLSSLLQDTEDSKMRVVVVRTYGGATSSFCSSGIIYWFVMKEIA